MSGVGTLVRRGLRALVERRWLFAVPVATLLAPAAFYVVHQPDTYKAFAVVSVRQVNAERVGGALPTTQEWRPEQILATVRDRVLQADNVGALIPVLWPKGNPRDPYTIEQARGRVLYDQAGDTRFSISLVDASPARAAEAVNVLVDAFIATERAAKAAPAERRREFLEEEAKRAKEAYERALLDMEAFRRAHADTMPDQKDAITNELHRFEQEAREREAEAQRNRLLVPEVDKWMRTSLPGAPAEGGRPTASADEQLAQLKLASSQSALDQAKKQLAELRAKYTDKHEPVRVAMAEVASLEAQVLRTKDELEAARKRADADTSARRRADNRELMESMRQFRESLIAEEKSSRAAAEELRSRAQALARRLAEIPSTDDALRKLRPALQAAELDLQRKSEAAGNARVAADFYRNAEPAETIGFTIESRAVPPVTPSGPARTRLLATAIAAGLAIGYGLHVLRRRYVDEDLVTKPEDLAELVPGALVVSVPVLGEGPVRRRVGAWDVVCGAWVAACLAGTFFALACHRGWLEAPAWFAPWLGGRA